MSELRKPTTLKDAFIAELMGDLGILIEDANKIVQEMELLKASLPKTGDRTAEQVRLAGDKIRAGLAKDREDFEIILDNFSKEIRATANIVDGSARRFQIMALVAGLAGGVIGGLLIGFALANKVFGG